MIAIIGGGPAAIGAALACRERAVILERNEYCGKKLLISGAGQCNFTNSLSSEAFLARLGEFRNWLKPAFYALNNRALMRIVEDSGCPFQIRDDGKVFPKSLRAQDLRDSLIKHIVQAGTKISYESQVTRIIPAEEGFEIRIKGQSSLRADKVIVCSGGAAWPQTGSDGSSYELARSLGIEVIPPAPALASVTIEDYSAFRSCAGISLRSAGVAHEKKRLKGDLLFTHTGLSGPVILDKSYRMTAGDKLRISIADSSDLLRLIQEHPKKQLRKIVPTLGLPQSLSCAILDYLGIPKDSLAADFRASDRHRLCSALDALDLRIKSIQDIRTSMSDFGGVSLKEISSKSMESKKIPGLFFAGESLAYSLPTGGFSIQMAFSTGYMAGRKAMNTI